VTGAIIGNFPSQICFRTENRNQSRMILDHDGAETLEADELMYQCRGDSLVHRVRMPVQA
jgi:DNA segregation ATPase FtsK/SpoIIIE-like protein